MKNKKHKIVRGCRNRHSIVVRCEFRLRNVQSAYNGLLYSLHHNLSLTQPYIYTLSMYSLFSFEYLDVTFYLLFNSLVTYFGRKM